MAASVSPAPPATPMHRPDTQEPPVSLTAALRSRAPHLYPATISHWLVRSPLHQVADVRFSRPDLRGAKVEADFLASVPVPEGPTLGRATVQVLAVFTDGTVSDTVAYQADPPKLAEVVQLPTATRQAVAA